MRIGVVLVVCVVLFGSLACGDDEPTTRADVVANATASTPQAKAEQFVPSPTSEPNSEDTVTAGVSDGCTVLPDGCVFADQLVGLLAAADVTGFLALTEQRDYECPVGLRPLEGPWPLCIDVPAGESRAGIVMGRLKSEVGILRPDVVEQQLQEWTAGGATGIPGPTLELATVGCPIVDGQLTCDGRYTVVLRRVTPQGDLDLIALVVDPADGPSVVKLSMGTSELNRVLVDGGRSESTLDVSPTEVDRPRFPTFYFRVRRQ